MSKLVKMINKSDIKVFYAVNRKAKCKALDKFMPYITNCAGPLVVIPIALFLYFYSSPTTTLRRMSVELIYSLAFSHLMVQILKRTVTRVRPGFLLDDVYVFKNFNDYSFPSGHTTAAFSIAVATMLFYQVPGLILMFLAIIIGISRMYIGVHYPSDVLTGAVLGTVFPLVIHAILI